MKTTVDIPEKELEDAMRFLGARSKREAVVTALREFNRRHRMARLVKFSNTLEFDANEAIEAIDPAEGRARACRAVVERPQCEHAPSQLRALTRTDRRAITTKEP